jgi:peptidoglycan/xylan/chitin deacetylase (PgdA/CDA1 family)
VLIGIVMLAGLAWLFYFRDYIAAQKMTQYRQGQEYQDKQKNSSIHYDAEKEISSALATIQRNKSMAAVLTGAREKEAKIALTFDGIGSQSVMDKILESLQKYQMKATFFSEGMQAAEDSSTILKIKAAGFAVENYSLYGWPQIEKISVEKQIFDFCQSKKIFQLALSIDSKILKCNETNYTDQLRQAAFACGFQQIVKSDVVVTAQTIKAIASEQSANEYVSKIKPGSIVSIKVKANRDQPTDAKMLPQSVDKSDSEVVLAVENILAAVKKRGLETVSLTELTEKINQNK